MAKGYSFSLEDRQDLVIEILSRTPVKSIIRCTSVCKSWYTLIKSSHFITKHLNRSRKALLSNDDDDEEAPLFAICRRGVTDSMFSWVTSTVSFHKMETTTPVVPDSLPCRDGKFTPTTMGPIDGIYCWTYKENLGFSDLVLCNPGLREVKAIPKVPRCALVPRTVNEEKGSYTLTESYGFGYDPNTNDYKVVAITGAKYGNPYGLQIFVYTLSSNSWRKMQIDLDDMLACPDRQTSPVLSDGNRVCHWLATDKQRDRVMLSFDFGSEAFKSSPLPQGHGCDLNASSLYLSVLNESSIILIAMGDGCSRHDVRVETRCCYEIFMMNEDGGGTGKEGWTMLYTIEPIPGVDKPLGFRKNGEIILAKSDGSLVTYDPSFGQMNLLHICRQGFTGYQVCTYMESLISVHGRS